MQEGYGCGHWFAGVLQVRRALGDVVIAFIGVAVHAAEHCNLQDDPRNHRQRRPGTRRAQRRFIPWQVNANLPAPLHTYSACISVLCTCMRTEGYFLFVLWLQRLPDMASPEKGAFEVPQRYWQLTKRTRPKSSAPQNSHKNAELSTGI